MKEEYDLRGAKRGAVVSPPEHQTRVTMWLDNDTLEWFRAQVNAAGGGDWQEDINVILKQYIAIQQMFPSSSAPEPIEEVIPRVEREKLSPVPKQREK